MNPQIYDPKGDLLRSRRYVCRWCQTTVSVLDKSELPDACDCESPRRPSWAPANTVAVEDARQDAEQPSDTLPQMLKALPLSIDWIFKTASATPQYLVDGLVSSVGVTVLSGDTGAGKSVIALDLTFALAAGLSEFHGLALTPPNVTAHDRQVGHQVLYIDNEMSDVSVSERMAAWLAGNRMAHSAEVRAVADQWLRNITYCTFPEARLAMPDRSLLEAMRREHPGPYRLVVLDTLTALSAIENSNDDMQVQRTFEEAEAIGRLYGCPVLMLCHPSKEATPLLRKAMESGNAPDPNLAVRGSGRIVQAATMVHVLTAAKRTDEEVANAVPAVGLLGNAKNRVGARSEQVTRFELRLVQDDAMPRPSVVLGGFRAQPSSHSKLGDFADWVNEHAEDWISVGDYEDRRNKGLPSERTVSGYLRDRADQLADLGVEIRKGKRGRYEFRAAL